MCISFDIRIYMFTCTKKHFFPIRFLQEKRHPGPFLTSPGRYGSSSTWCIASHGSKEILAMYLEVWEKNVWVVFYKKNRGKQILTIYIYPVNSLFLYLFIVFTLHCFFAMCSEPLAVSSDISGKCLFVFLEADASKQHLWHLGCFWQDDGCDFTHPYVFFVPNFFFVWIPSWSLP